MVMSVRVCRQRLTERFIACKVLKPLLSALTEVHSRQIVHRSAFPACCFDFPFLLQ